MFGGRLNRLTATLIRRIRAKFLTEDFMNASAIQAKYTKVVKIAGKWNCYLQIDQQGFCVADNRTKKEAVWYAKMLGIALERLVESVKNA